MTNSEIQKYRNSGKSNTLKEDLMSYIKPFLIFPIWKEEEL
jgi:hypothetical protein